MEFRAPVTGGTSVMEKGSTSEGTGREVFKEGMSEESVSLSRQRDREGPEVKKCRQVKCSALCHSHSGC